MVGTRIKLPHYDSLPEGVYFHQDTPGFKRVILQVPNEDRSDSETYVVDLEDFVHIAWMEGLSNSRNLLATLEYAQHIAFCPRTGFFQEMPDLDEPTETAKRVARARRDASFEQSVDKLTVARRTHLRRQAPGPSKLRRALAGRRRGRL